jgi:hypothetical protein
MKSKKRDYIGYGVCLGFALLILLSTFEFQRESSKVGPWIVSFSTIVMSTAGIIRTATRKAPVAKAGTEGEEPKKKGRHARQMAPYVKAGSWLVGLTVGILTVGFLPSILVFTAAYVKSHEGKWLPAIATGLIMSFLTYIVFIDLLETPLFQGAIPEIFPFLGGERLW